MSSHQTADVSLTVKRGRKLGMNYCNEVALSFGLSKLKIEHLETKNL